MLSTRTVLKGTPLQKLYNYFLKNKKVPQMSKELISLAFVGGHKLFFQTTGGDQKYFVLFNCIFYSSDPPPPPGIVTAHGELEMW